MIKSKFSLKYKILALLTLIPLISLGIYIYLAVDVFKKDKVAYVSDTSASVTGSMASQVKSELTKVLMGSRPLIQDFILQSDFNENSKQLFSNESSLDIIIALEKELSTGAWNRKKMLEKKIDLAETYWSVIEKNINEIFPVVIKNGRFVKNPFLDERMFLFEYVKDPQTKKEFIFVIVSNFSELSKVFTGNSAQKLFLTFDNG